MGKVTTQLTNSAKSVSSILFEEDLKSQKKT